MYQSFYHGNPFLDLPILAMLLFALTFSAVVLRAWIKGGADPHNDRLSRLPLEEPQALDP